MLYGLGPAFPDASWSWTDPRPSRRGASLSRPVLSERHAERILRDYVRYCHGRPHRSLRTQPPRVRIPGEPTVVGHKRLDRTPDLRELAPGANGPASVSSFSSASALAAVDPARHRHDELLSGVFGFRIPARPTSDERPFVDGVHLRAHASSQLCLVDRIEVTRSVAMVDSTGLGGPRPTWTNRRVKRNGGGAVVSKGTCGEAL